ncbi:PAS domain S-box protein [Polyangium jinanense]|uniref:PAS domain S-box protein n=1 Tax=Polyangium jinanense TaxID=2829994 RepID=A0A9X4AR33_9BACT|nr:PAS domain S-box protein [Polyangium jinanense]MDC3955393.1 PAS domain S-box protein [Polyangium jinanense]MDC3981694.1 PAS domain S-box protein [Polyangium jinanense]
MGTVRDVRALSYERFFQTSGDILAVLDREGRFVHANEAFRDVLGYLVETLLGQSFATIVHPDDAAEVRAFLEGDGEGDTTLRVTKRLLHRDLSTRTVAFALRRVTEDEAFYVTGRAVNEQESAEASRRREEVLQKMQVTARVGGWEVDNRTGDLYWTEETYRIHEVPPGFRPILETAINFYTPEAIPIITAAVQGCMRGEAYDLELQILTARGRRLWVRASGHPVFEDGKVVRLIGAFQDIDDFKRRELELQEKLAIIEEQRTAIHAMSAPIIQVWDGVLALPVVGMLDEARASEITGRMLSAVVAHAARYAILDLTGVESVDEATADHVVRIIRSIQLLGAQSIVTGIRPAVAQTLISLGAGFAGARTVSNLREAIKICMRGK